MKRREFYQEHDDQLQAEADIQEIKRLYDLCHIERGEAEYALREAGACEPEIQEIINRKE